MLGAAGMFAASLPGASLPAASLPVSSLRPLRLQPAALALLLPADRRANLTVLDLTRSGIVGLALQDFARLRPDIIASAIVREGWTAEVGGTLLEAIEAGTSGIDLVISSQGAALEGMALGLWQPLGRWVLDQLPPLETILTPLALRMLALMAPYALPLAAAPGGPVLVHRQGIATPRNPAELLDWARENPRRFLYLYPPLTQGGRCFLAALPFLLGDAAPSDPERGWDRTWAFLEALDPHIAFYPVTGLGAAEEFQDGECDMLALSLSEDILFRGLDLLPADTDLGAFEPSALVPVGTCLMVPRDLDAADAPEVALLIAYLMSEAVQDDLTFGQGRRWSQSAHRDALLEDRPLAVQVELHALMRPGMEALIAAHPVTPPYPLAAWNAMFDLWEARIGAQHGQL